MSENKSLATLKKAFIFILLLISVLTIAACADNESIPGGSINNNNFITIGDHSVTNQQLYEALKPNSSSILRQIIEETLFADYLDDIDLNDTVQRRHIERQINTAIFGQSTVEGIVLLHPQSRARSILTFVDSMTATNPTLNGIDLINFIEERLTAWEVDFNDVTIDTEDEDFDFGWTNSTSSFASAANALVDLYRLSLAQFNFARNILYDEVLDDSSSVYISELDLVNFFRNNLEGRHEIAAFIVTFNSVSEHELARFRYQVKPNARGDWFQLPDVFSEAGFNAILAADVNDAAEDGYAYARQLLEELNIPLTDFATFQSRIAWNTPEYQLFYNRWILTRNRQTNAERMLSEDEVLTLFLAMDDDLRALQNPSRRRFTTTDPDNMTVDGITLNAGVNRESLIEQFTFEFDNPIFRANPTLRTEAFALAANTLADAEGSAFSRAPNNLGGSNAFYLVFGLSTDQTEYEIIDDSNEEEPIFNVDSENGSEAAAAAAARQEAWDELFERRLTSTYINSKVAEFFDEASINIYDRIIRIFFEHEFGYDGTTRFRDNETVASANGTPILVDYLFDRLTEMMGVAAAADMILLEILEDLYYDEITTDERDAMRTQFENTLTAFRNNQLAGSGFPSTLGMNNFLLLAFNADGTEDAFQRAHIQPRLRELFAEDYVNHYGANTETSNIFEMFAQLAAVQFDEFLGVNTSHVLLYFDLNNDGSPDNPDQFTLDDFAGLGIFPTNLTATTTEQLADVMAQLEVRVEQLAILVRNRTAIGAINVANLTRVINTFTESTRFGNFLLDDTNIDVWTEFRQLGLNLRVESLGAITNSTNNPGSGSGFDARFFAHTMNIAAALTDVLGDDPTSSEKSSLLPFFALPGTYSWGDSETGIVNLSFTIADTRSDFGWHLLLITDVTQRNSAQLAEPDTGYLDPAFISSVRNPWTDEYLNAYNPDQTLTADQIMIFIEESKLETGVESLSSAIITAINSYFAPIRAIYDSQFNQLELAFRLLAQTANRTINDEGFLPDLGNAALNSQLLLLRQANLNQMFSYGLFFTDTPNTFQQIATVPTFATLYQNWFNILMA